MTLARSTLIIAFLMLTGCATPAPRLPHASGRPSGHAGYIMFAITATGPAISTRRLCLSLDVRGIANSITEMLTSCMRHWLLPANSASRVTRESGEDIGEGDPLGKMVLMELPPGEYEFDAYTGTESSFDSRRYFSPRGFEYKFDVVATMVNYLGDLNFSLTRHSTPPRIGNLEFNAARGVGLNFQVLDGQERDAPLFDTRFPGYSQMQKMWCGGCVLHNP
jgi:hypothetical protein